MKGPRRSPNRWAPLDVGVLLLANAPPETIQLVNIRPGRKELVLVNYAPLNVFLTPVAAGGFSTEVTPGGAMLAGQFVRVPSNGTITLETEAAVWATFFADPNNTYYCELSYFETFEMPSLSETINGPQDAQLRTYSGFGS